MNQNSVDLNLLLKNLPTLPGVYRMLDKNGQVLYVGKAINLKRRVSSYFQKQDLSPRIQLMVKQIHTIETTVTRNEAEALILENNLIKSLTPKYNILFRDDKSYPYLMLTKHSFPQLTYYRGTPKKPHQYFGPYPNAYAVRDSIQILQKVFQLRTCEDSVFQHRDRACLLHQIKRCSAPCVGHISPENYQDRVQQAADFLNGKTQELIHSLQSKMQQAASYLQFEDAAYYRDQLQTLSIIQSQQFIDSKHHHQAHNIDILALVVEESIVCLHWVSIRGGRHIGDKNFFPNTHHDPQPNGQEYAEAFVAQHYLNQTKPDIIISNFNLPTGLQTALNSQQTRPIQFITHTVGERKVWLNMAERNAQLAIQQHQSQHNKQQHRIEELARILNMDTNNLKRIECFDISHTQGEATIASCVVYDDYNIQPKQYRRYNITTTQIGDDYAAMREVLMRHYSKLLEAQAHGEIITFPDVVLIDGGKGQINIALKIWEELGLTIPIIGIAKGVTRKAGLEELILPFTHQTLRLPPNSPALHLLQTIRDEAHRFAITGHRQKRDKNRLHSSLNSITGIGKKRRQALLTHFGGLRGVMAASKEDLAHVEGISHTLAEKIYNNLHE